MCVRAYVYMYVFVTVGGWGCRAIALNSKQGERTSDSVSSIFMWHRFRVSVMAILAMSICSRTTTISRRDDYEEHKEQDLKL